jgi:hypothetical protein
MLLHGDKEWIKSLFPMPNRSVVTNGTEEGLILKFRSFYLKIYYADSIKNEYIVQGYRYQEDSPVFVDYVNRADMKNYCSQFCCEDFLSRRG